MEEHIGKQTIEIAEEKFQLLIAQSNNTQISTSTTLELASQIRDCISRNEEITEFINANEEYASRRKNLLDEIRKMQLDIVAKHTEPEIDLGNLDGNIKDFNKAKQDMVAMIKAEQSLQMFAETESPKLFETIKETEIHEQTLRRVADACKNGRYLVLIMGDFQSGKSTTINALCDGRYVCAIGNGTATSAVPVTVTYADVERTEICWRTKEWLMSIIDKTVREFLPDYDLKTFNIDDSQARLKLAEAISALRTGRNCPNMGDENAKFLMLCDFILQYYGSPELVEKKETLQTSASPAEITKFPEKDEVVWKKQGVKEFSLEEVLFVFIEKVNCYIQSETLRNLNCIIEDTPGLFNNPYDTMVTEQAMINANAIMYVLPYSKEMGKDARSSLYNIKTNYRDVLRKLFIVNNLEPGKGKVFRANCEKIKAEFGAEKITYRYDANLAYLLQLKRLFDNGRASEKDYQHLMSVTMENYDDVDEEKTFNSFNEAWAYHFDMYKRSLRENYNSVLQGDVEAGLRESGFIDMTGALRDFIESNNAYSVIVSDGLEPMTRELSVVRNCLHINYIEPYLHSQEEMKKLWEDRIKQATVFQEFVSTRLHEKIFTGKEPLFSRMVQEEYDKLFTEDFYKDLSYEVAGVIYDNRKELRSIEKRKRKGEFKDEEEHKRALNETFTPLIEEGVKDLVESRLWYLNILLESKQDTTIRNMFVPEMENVEYKLMEKWSELFGNDINFKMENYFILSKALKPVDEIISGSNNDTVSDVSVAMPLTKKWNILEIAGIVVSCAAALGGIVVNFFTGIGGIPISLLGVTGAVGAQDWARKRFVKGSGDKLLPEIKKDESIRRFKSDVESQLKLVITKYIDAQKIDIQKMESARDLAAHPIVEREKLCFRSVEAIEQLDEQIHTYEKYKQKHLNEAI